MPRRLIVVLCLAALATAACTSSGSPTPPSPPAQASITPASPSSRYHPAIDPANFVKTVDNPHLPWIPGTTWVYKGVSEGERELNRVFVTHGTKEILGVAATVVHDQVFRKGELVEDTFDWYAQDREGNVWYFGEDTRELENGKVVSTEGSWESGVDGAQPGILMPADPQVADSFRQEFYQGHAEDMAWFLGLNRSISVPYGSFKHAILTVEWTPLEPKIFGLKYYVSGIGMVEEANAAGPKETSSLVSVTKP